MASVRSKDRADFLRLGDLVHGKSGTRNTIRYGVALSAFVVGIAWHGAASAQQATVSDSIGAGKLLLEARARYEYVDQKGIANPAEAATFRTRFGWETGAWNDFTALVEFEDVRQIGAERYNVQVPGVAPSLNGKTQYPIVNDPDVTELNRAQLAWMPSANFGAIAGRQRILTDDQRFVGNVGWRQDEQTFDGVKIDTGLSKLKISYAYISKVNRILGEERDWESDSHLLNLTYAVSEPLKLQAFSYALDFSNSAANSSLTTGAKVSGKTWIGLYQIAYDATYAQQSDYRSNTPAYALDYTAASVAGTFDVYTLRLGYEALEGDGTRGFTTPLATTHAFQGWADAWVSPGGNKSFVDGVDDLNVSLTAQPRFRLGPLFNTAFLLRYHDFDAGRTGADLGREWDAQMTAAVTPKLTALLKYADFKREDAVPAGTAPPPASRAKIWFSLEYRY